MRASNGFWKQSLLIFLVSLTLAACAQSGGHPFADGALGEQGIVADPGYKLYQGAMQY